jgi:hypothetical protein
MRHVQRWLRKKFLTGCQESVNIVGIQLTRDVQGVFIIWERRMVDITPEDIREMHPLDAPLEAIADRLEELERQLAEEKSLTESLFADVEKKQLEICDLKQRRSAAAVRAARDYLEIVDEVNYRGERIAALEGGWNEASLAWSVCASVHEKWAKGKDALFTTRQADYQRHYAEAVDKVRALKVGEDIA